ncbi:hypothetical protein AB0H57_16510 [Micromonospora sp. NPDC050686]
MRYRPKKFWQAGTKPPPPPPPPTLAPLIMKFASESSRFLTQTS